MHLSAERGPGSVTVGEASSIEHQPAPEWAAACSPALSHRSAAGALQRRDRPGSRSLQNASDPHPREDPSAVLLTRHASAYGVPALNTADPRQPKKSLAIIPTRRTEVGRTHHSGSAS